MNALRVLIYSGLLGAILLPGRFAAAQFQPLEIEFFDRTVTGPSGQPVFVPDWPTLQTEVGPPFSFEGGTAVAFCCSAFTANGVSIGLSTAPQLTAGGNQALKISMPNQERGSFGTAFQRPAILTIPSTDPRHATFNTVAQNPANFSIALDLTLIADEVPDTFNTGPDPLLSDRFIRIGFFHNSNGFNENPVIRDLELWTDEDIDDLEATGISRRSVEFSATDFDLPAIGQDGFAADANYTFGFVLNGNWEVDEPLSFNVDNIRFTARFELADLDINSDTVLDALDFEALMLHHLNPDADTFAEGDLDGDGDNDFDDFRFFEDGWNTLGGPIPFSALLGVAVPEPSTVVFVILAGSTFVIRRNRPSRLLALVACSLVALVSMNAAQAQLADTLLFSWEGDLEGWDVSGNDQLGVTLGNSALGATEGNSSLSLQQPLDGFNFGAFTSQFGAGNVVREAFDEAFDIGAEHFVLEMDVTYDTLFIPVGTFVNVSMRIDTGVASGQVDSLALFDYTSSPQTVSISEPLSNWSLQPQGGLSGFVNFELAINGDWGFTPATVFFDNMRLRQVSEPALLTLEVNTGTGATRILNNSGADGTGVGGSGDSVQFNYYQILSGDEAGPEDTEPDGDVDGADFLELQRSNSALIGDWQTAYGTSGGGSGSLNPNGWDPLDDGSPGLGGWTASGGVDSALAESNFLDSTTLADTDSLLLGDAFTPGGSENLSFFYREPGRPDFLRQGNVVYVGGPALGAAAAVPEPSTYLLMLAALVAMNLRHGQ